MKMTNALNFLFFPSAGELSDKDKFWSGYLKSEAELRSDEKIGDDVSTESKRMKIKPS